jgi:hypothetical protein
MKQIEPLEQWLAVAFYTQAAPGSNRQAATKTNHGNMRSIVTVPCGKLEAHGHTGLGKCNDISLKAGGM